MKKNLSTLCFAGLVALTGLVATGCGSDTTTGGNIAPSTNIREYVVIANNVAAGGFTIKNLNLQNGTSSILTTQTANVGADTNNSIMVKTHPNVNVFYVLNKGTAARGTISTYTVDANGAATALGAPVPAPVNPQFLSIHPAGGLVYVGGAPAGNNALGDIQRYTVANNGALTLTGLPVKTAFNMTIDFANRVKDVDYSFGGGALHVGTVNHVETFNIAADGTLTPSGQVSLLGGAAFEALDVDVRPGQASLEAVVRTNNAVDNITSFPVANGVLGAGTNTVTAEAFLWMGDFASNGQYYVGAGSQAGGPNDMLGFNVVNDTGALSPLGTNPMNVALGTSSSFVNLDPSNNFILSTGANNSVLVARFRGADGNFIGSTVDSQGLTNASGFDYFNFNF